MEYVYKNKVTGLYYRSLFEDCVLNSAYIYPQGHYLIDDNLYKYDRLSYGDAILKERKLKLKKLESIGNKK